MSFHSPFLFQTVTAFFADRLCVLTYCDNSLFLSTTSGREPRGLVGCHLSVLALETVIDSSCGLLQLLGANPDIPLGILRSKVLHVCCARRSKKGSNFVGHLVT